MGQAKLTSISESKAANFDRKADERDTLWCDRIPGLHLIKLKKGCTWRYRYRDATGKRRTATIGKLGEKKPEQAARVVLDWSDNEADPLEERKQQRQQALTAREQAERRTLRHYLETEYQTHMEAWKPANAKNTEQRLRNHFAEWLDRDMATLTKQDVKGWQTRAQQAGYAKDTIKRNYTALKTLMNCAVDDEVLEANPLDGIKLKPASYEEQQKAEKAKEDKKADRRMLTDDEIRSVLAGLEAFAEEARAERRNSRAHGKSYLPDLDTAHHPHWFIPMAHLALHTGLRPGDLRTMTWDELNIRFGRLKKEPSKTKEIANRRDTPAAVVDMKLNDTIKEIMRGWWEDQGRPNTGLVFPSPRTGRELDRQATRKPWKRVKELAGLAKDMDFYCFRHHFISAQLAAGVPMFTVAKMAGHKTVTMIQEHYGHICEQQSDDAVDVVGATITRAAKGAAV